VPQALINGEKVFLLLFLQKKKSLSLFVLSRMSNCVIATDRDALATQIADWFAARVAAATGRVRVALSGGSTPRDLFAKLARPPYQETIPWSRVELFWGDERFVPGDDPESNYGMTRRTLLDHIAIPAANIHPIPTDGTPAEAASRYEALLKRIYGAAALDPARPLFDIVFLGLGEDGHTASLIPGQKVLAERKSWVAAVSQGRPEIRVTLTYPALESCRFAAFLVAGASKAAICRAVRAGKADVPAAHLRPAGETLWFLDRAAAS
jgi:6-phosphogluconolactonase